MVSKAENAALCERYPFLIPRSLWSGEIHPDYDYSFTKLDDLPEGWRIAFGEELCEEIKAALLRDGGEEALNAYRVLDIKEKYGVLRWYDRHGNNEIYKLINQYAARSAVTCIQCGKPATKRSMGYICPYCDACAGKLPGFIRFQEIRQHNTV